MASRLNYESDSSGDELTEDEYNNKRKKAGYSEDDGDEVEFKKSRRDSSFDENYSSRGSEDEAKDGDSAKAPKSYYSKDKSDDESEEKSDSSCQDNSSTNSTSGKKSFQAENKKNASLSKAEMMMQKWGFKSGGGIGRDLQGRAEPVAASTQKGRRGLGLQLKELEKAQTEFNPDEEIVEVVEKILWLQNNYPCIPSNEEVGEWLNDRKLGPKKETIDGETMFCDEDILESVVQSKSVFDRLDSNEMREARTRSNPFETIRGSIFLNRAAVKMANIDKACDFMFTNPPNLHSDELLYFADVCAGPGGFSEYVLWRKKWRAKGFGFTLRNENDFKLDDFHGGPCETFHPYYGPSEDGDVYKPENQLALKELIMKQTDNKGVHFMMADGGFSVDGQFNIQEILSKQLYLCQCLVALMIVRDGGNFVTKVFDLFTPFSAGLVYIMFRCFESISIFKPNTSRPANSERYLICKGKHPNIEHIIQYLFDTNKKLLKNSKNNEILELVPSYILLGEKHFFEYLKESNDELGHRQIIGLKKIAAYTENKTLFETRQKIMREECLKHWELPDEARTLPRRMNANAKAQMLLQDSIGILESSSKDIAKLTPENLNTILFNEHDWYCMPCASKDDDKGEPKTTFYLGMGRSHVYKYCDKGRWEPVINIELPRDTLIYGEMLYEFKKEGRSQTKTYGLHIIDAFILGSENVSKKYLTERLKLAQLFCRALWKPADRNFIPVRVKELIPVNLHMAEKLSLEMKAMKSGEQKTELGYSPVKYFYENDSENPYYYIPKSIIFLKAPEEPWHCHVSNSQNKHYFYNKITKKSDWDTPDSARASFSRVLQSRIIWKWPNNELLSMNNFIDCLKQKYSSKN